MVRGLLLVLTKLLEDIAIASSCSRTWKSCIVELAIVVVLVYKTDNIEQLA